MTWERNYLIFYPMFVTIGDSTFPLRTVSKKFNTLEDMFKYYAKSISYKEETHNHIIELIKWAKDNTNFLCFNISEFVISRKWEEIEALKSGEGDTNITLMLFANYDYRSPTY